MVEDDNIHRLKVEDKEVILIGTAHVSHESAELVKKVIEVEKPDTVCVELCEMRYESIKKKDAWRDMDIIKVIKEGKTFMLLVNFLLASFQRRMAKKMDIKPGQEMIQAIDSANEHNMEISVIDRNIRTTLTRTIHNIGFWKKMSLASSSLFSVFDDEEIDEAKIEELKQKDTLELLLEEMGENLPEIKHSLIDERDLYMVQKIRESKGDKLVAVVGAGHVPGMKKNWEAEISIEDLDIIPPKSKIGKIIKWLIPLVVIGIFVAGFYMGDVETLKDQFMIWVYSNAIFSAIGAIVAFAHPLTIIVAAVAAPITSLNPTIGAGMVAGLAEAWFRKPKVADFEQLPEDIQTMKGWWGNGVTRLILVVMLVSVGSAIGTFAALPLMLKLFGS